MEPWEVMTSESQERMLAIVTPESWPASPPSAPAGRCGPPSSARSPRPSPAAAGACASATVRRDRCWPTCRRPPSPTTRRSTTARAGRPSRRQRGRSSRRRATDVRRRPARPRALAALGLPPVRPPAVPQHGGGTRAATPPCCGWPAPGCRPRTAGVAAHHRLQPPGLRARPAGRHGAGAGRGRGQPGLRRCDAGGRRQLPELRQSRAPRGHVAALRVHRRHGRGLPGAGAPGRSGATSASTTRAAGADIDPTPVLGVLGLVDAVRAPPPGLALGRGRHRRPAREARRAGRVVPAGRHPLGDRAARPPHRPRAGARLRGARARCAPSSPASSPSRWPGRAGTRWCAPCTTSRAAASLSPLAEMAAAAGHRLRRWRWATRPSSSPSCPRASWWRRPTPTSCAPGPTPSGIPHAVLGRAGGDRLVLGDPGRPPRRRRARRPTRGIWPWPWAIRDGAGLCENG